MNSFFHLDYYKVEEHNESGTRPPTMSHFIFNVDTKIGKVKKALKYKIG